MEWLSTVIYLMLAVFSAIVITAAVWRFAAYKTRKGFSPCERIGPCPHCGKSNANWQFAHDPDNGQVLWIHECQPAYKAVDELMKTAIELKIDQAKKEARAEALAPRNTMDGMSPDTSRKKRRQRRGKLQRKMKKARRKTIVI